MRQDWKTSFHGGHSGQFCDHAKGSLKDVVSAAIKHGFSVYGLSEHCPRYDSRHLFKEEVDHGYSVEKLIAVFEDYSHEAAQLQAQHADKIELLRGFETEFVSEDYLDKMAALRRTGEFDFMVGSVHHVEGICIDAYPEWTIKAIEACGGLEALAIEYYRSVEKMVAFLKPEIVGHLDLIKKFGDVHGPLDTPAIRRQMEKTLATVKQHGALLDLNVYPFRLGKDAPYPAAWIIAMARKENIDFCFGDDSHSPDTVGVGIDEGRDYLLSCGVESITVLSMKSGNLTREQRSLI